MRQGILDVRWLGRLEKIGESPTVILDGAQNAESAKKLIAGVKRHFHYEKLFLVLGVSSDKDLDGILSELMPETHCLIATQSKSPRALSAPLIAEHAKEFGKEALVELSALSAAQKAKSLAGANDLILVTGSLFLVGEIKAKDA